MMIGGAVENGEATGGHVVPFPLTSRIGEVRAAAAELIGKRSMAAATKFRNALAGRKFAELAALGLDEETQDEAVGAFLSAVEREMAELHYERIRLHL